MLASMLGAKRSPRKSGNTVLIRVMSRKEILFPVLAPPEQVFRSGNLQAATGGLIQDTDVEGAQIDAVVTILNQLGKSQAHALPSTLGAEAGVQAESAEV